MERILFGNCRRRDGRNPARDPFLCHLDQFKEETAVGPSGGVCSRYGEMALGTRPPSRGIVERECPVRLEEPGSDYEAGSATGTPSETRAGGLRRTQFLLDPGNDRSCPTRDRFRLPSCSGRLYLDHAPCDGVRGNRLLDTIRSLDSKRSQYLGRSVATGENDLSCRGEWCPNW